MRKIIFIIIFFSMVFQAQAQFEDSIRKSLTYPPKFFIQLNSRNGFITNRNIKTIGLVAGIRFHKNLYFGLAYNQLWTKITTEDYIDPNVNFPLDLKLHYYSFAPAIEYSYFASKRWQISIPVQLTFGYAYYTDQNNTQRYSGMIIAYEPGISASYYLFRFFSLGFGVGYRLAVYKNSHILDRFTAPTYQIKTGIYLGELFKKKE